MTDWVYTSRMRSTRAIFAILLSFALFVQGVAASTVRSCHMRSNVAEQAIPHPSHQRQHQHDSSDGVAQATEMSTSSEDHEPHAASSPHHDESDQSKSPKSSKLTSCAWCAACCMGLALPVSGVTSPDLFPSARTVFPPLAVAPPSRLPGGWDRPPRA